jgi:hypothetical protein
VDDAYISYRYGKNLMNGDGLVYNKGEYVEGYTNFLWTVITAPFTVISFADVSVFATVLCLILSIFNITFLGKIGRLFNSDFLPYTSLIVVVLRFFSRLMTQLHSGQSAGMEPPLFTLFILTAVYSYFRINDGDKYTYYLAISLMLITLTRPEGNMIIVILLFHSIIFRSRITNFKNLF